MHSKLGQEHRAAQAQTLMLSIWHLAFGNLPVALVEGQTHLMHHSAWPLCCGYGRAADPAAETGCLQLSVHPCPLLQLPVCRIADQHSLLPI